MYVFLHIYDRAPKGLWSFLREPLRLLSMWWQEHDEVIDIVREEQSGAVARQIDLGDNKKVVSF